ncbi:mitogen-activated protein kinase kinase kinase 20-like [Cornus florida]|uniref:mitogen-activated protein kinase kinase kinase 20-like n=1 Tax=Cornus florida TaxID=4283 RepID=UPI00289E142C|nr:mitogen-activated protein kinase kinase kinase 20-like [Cornus florida]
MASDWVISELLGSGSNAKVYLARSPFRLLPDMAVKSSVFSESLSLHREKAILDILEGCREIVACYGFQETIIQGEKYYDLLLEYAPRGTLADLINNRGGKLSEAEVKVYSRMILKGLCYIHDKGYVHCDIKPANILVFPSFSSCGVENQVKIADFGNSKKAGHIFVGGYVFGKFRCTPLYTSPESVKLGLNEAPMDIWSLGCVMVEMFSGKPAWSFENVYDLLFQIGFGEEVPHIPEGFSENAKNFLKKCLVKDPNQRWTAKMLLNHPFMVEDEPLPSLKKASRVVQHRVCDPFKNWDEAKLINYLFS